MGHAVEPASVHDTISMIGTLLTFHIFLPMMGVVDFCTVSCWKISGLLFPHWIITPFYLKYAKRMPISNGHLETALGKIPATGRISFMRSF